MRVIFMGSQKLTLKMSRMRGLFVALALLAAAPSSAQPAATAPRTLTFFVGSDSHFGFDGMEDANRAMVEQMNALPGTPYPDSIGGRVEAHIDGVDGARASAREQAHGQNDE